MQRIVLQIALRLCGLYLVVKAAAAFAMFFGERDPAQPVQVVVLCLAVAVAGVFSWIFAGGISRKLVPADHRDEWDTRSWIRWSNVVGGMYVLSAYVMERCLAFGLFLLTDAHRFLQGRGWFVVFVEVFVFSILGAALIRRPFAERGKHL